MSATGFSYATLFLCYLKYFGIKLLIFMKKLVQYFYLGVVLNPLEIVL